MTETNNALVMVDEKILAQYGVVPQDQPQIFEIVRGINFDSTENLGEFGSKTSEESAQFSDKLLAEVQNRDFDTMGKQLTSIVSLAQETNSQAFSGNGGRFPIIARLIRVVKGKRNHLLSVFDSSKEQIDKLLVETTNTRERLRSRNEILDTMFEVVKQEYRSYGLHIIAGKMAIDAKQKEIEKATQEARNPLEVQLAADMLNRVKKLEMRVSDFEALQQSSIQTLAKIRTIQATNEVLVDKYKTIREITIPSWKNQFLLEMGMNETSNAAALATEIDDFTDDLLVRGADLLHKNAVATAKSNQRAVISVKTLKHVDNTLMQIFQDVSKIQQQGTKDRLEASREIEKMQKSRALNYGTKPQITHQG